MGPGSIRFDPAAPALKSPVAELEDITLLLHEAGEGRPGALDDLMRLVYAELEQMARLHLRRQFGAAAASITLEPAALVNETFMRLIKQRSTLDNRGQFFGIATTLMLRVLIDYRRARNAEKRGGGETRLTLQFDGGVATSQAPAERDGVEIEALRTALERLEGLDDRKADVVKMRVVWGLNNTEVAAALGVSIPTVERDWRFARAWLAEQIALDGGAGSSREA